MTTHETMVERARDLAPLFAAHAREAEEQRSPVDSVIAAVEAAEIFKLMVPRCYGGLELDLDTFVDVGLALSEGDASHAWVTCFCIEHNWMLLQFPESFQRELFRDRSYILAPAVVAPTGRAPRVEGGYRLSGRWQWGSGIMHASWVLVSGLVEREGRPPDMRFFALPRGEVTVDDTWFVDGMAGTGSNDIVIEDCFVPDERTVSVAEMGNGTAPGSRLHDGPLYRTPMLPILSLAAGMPTIGQARMAVGHFRERALSRARFGDAKRQAERPAVQMRLAEVEIALHQAEMLLRHVAREVMELRDAATLEDRARWSAQAAVAVAQGREVIRRVCEASGASAHFRDHPLQRAMRDANTMGAHVIFDLDSRLETYGRLRFGLEPGAGLI